MSRTLTMISDRLCNTPFAEIRNRVLQGGRMVKTARGVVSFAAVVGAALLIAPASATAQAVPIDCPPNSTGPVIGDATPYDGGMCNLGTLGTDVSISEAFGISGNGQVVVGFVNQPASPGIIRRIRGFAWTSDGGMIELSPLSTISRTVLWRARAANYDGSIIVGNARADNNAARSVRWVNGVIEDLGSLLENSFVVDSNRINPQSNAFGVNYDGTVVVGGSTSLNSTSGNLLSRAFRWKDGASNGVSHNPEMQDLGTLRDDQSGTSFALGVNADGTVVVGEAQNGANERRAFRWVENGTSGVAANLEMQDLGTLRSVQTGTAFAYGVNADGTIVVGRASNDASEDRAFRWVEGGTSGVASNPEMQDLGTLRNNQTGNSQAFGVSADGTVVVGQADNDSGEQRAFQWVLGRTVGATNNAEMQDLGTLRTDQTGNSQAYGVSADGGIVVGWADSDANQRRAFIWGTQIQDYENLFESFSDLADDTEIAVAQQQHVLGRTLDTTCFAGMELQGGAPIGKVLPDIYVGGKNDTDAIAEVVEEVFINECFRASGWLSMTDADTAQDIGTRDSGMASLTYGRAVGAQTTVGGTIAVHTTSLASHSFDMGTGITGSLWAEYSETGRAHLGWQGGAAVGWGIESGTITRGLGLANVMPASGEADLSTFGARATIGYGMDRGDWLVTPSVTLAQFNTRRSAYTESGSDFDASYNALSLNRTHAKLQVNGARALSETGTLLVGLGLEHDISVDPVVLTGTTDGMPGLETFAIESRLDRRDMRFDAMIGWEQDLGANRVVGATLRAGQAVFGDAARIDFGVSYTVRF